MSTTPKKYWRLSPPEPNNSSAASKVMGVELPAAFLEEIKPRQGIVLARWDPVDDLGKVQALGVIRAVDQLKSDAAIDWVDADISFRPNPTGRRWWTQEKPYFGFAKDVTSRYMLDDLFAEHFPEFEGMVFGTTPKAPDLQHQARPSTSPTGGFVYVIRSKYGFKIGKTVNLKQRTRLFAVKLPFENSVEHYAWFDDYTQAERALHIQYHDKRLEGEWFNLSEIDLNEIKSKGRRISVEGI